MNKLKALFSKIKPESVLSKALFKTALVVLSAVLMLFTMIVNLELFVMLLILAVLGYFILELFRHFYEVENKKGRRR